MPDARLVRDTPLCAAWNLQGNASRSAFTSAAAALFGVELPTTPNTIRRSEALVAVWLGPRSWLVFTETPSPRFDGFAAKRDALNAAGGALFDVSASRVAFRIAGPQATPVLATACPLDLHPRAFAVGACAQTVLGRVNALLCKEDEAPTFLVMVARSFERDVKAALTDAASGLRSA